MTALDSRLQRRNVVPHTLPTVKILNIKKQKYVDTVYRGKERMFQVSVEYVDVDYYDQQFFYSWYIIDVSPESLSVKRGQRQLAEQGTLTWTLNATSLSTGLKLIEFEMKSIDTQQKVTDFGYINIAEPNLRAVISGGSESLRSSNRVIILTGVNSEEPGQPVQKRLGMYFKWSCFHGENNVPDILSDDDKISLPVVSIETKKPDCNLKAFTGQGAKAKLLASGNQVFYIRLIVRKDNRQAEFVQTLYAMNSTEEILHINIRCIRNCDHKVTSSNKLSLTVNCHSCRHGDVNFHWKLYEYGSKSNEFSTVWRLHKKLGPLTASKTNSKHIVLKRDALKPASSYRLTVDVQTSNGSRGWAAYKFMTAEAPSGGNCSGKQVERATLGVVLQIHCEGWNDNNLPLTYEFYRQIGNMGFILTSHSVISFTEVQIPIMKYGKVTFKVIIVNSVGVRSEQIFTLEVHEPGWLTAGYGFMEVFNDSVDGFHELLNRRNVQHAGQMAQVLIAAMEEDLVSSPLTFREKLKSIMVEKLSKEKASDIPSILQISSALRTVTEVVKEISPAIMENVMSALHEWTSVLKKRTLHASAKHAALYKDTYQMMLQCSGNIIAVSAKNVSGNKTSVEEVKRANKFAKNLTNSIASAVLFLKMPGEEYSVLKMSQYSLILGKHETQEISGVSVQEGSAGLKLPALTEEIRDRKFGHTSTIDVQVISYEFNPYSVYQTGRVYSKVVDIVLKDDKSQVMNVSDLPANISLSIALEEAKNRTPGNQDFTVPNVMLYRTVVTYTENTLIEVTLFLERRVPFEIYVRYETKPTQLDFDHFVVLDGSVCQQDVQSCIDNNKTRFHAKHKGKYYIGLLQKDYTSNRERRSTGKRVKPEQRKSLMGSPQQRNARSVQSGNSAEEPCVKLKELTLEGATVQYDPETSVNFTLEVNWAECLHWSEDEEKWKSDGCIVDVNSNATVLQCLCNHLTSFGGYFLPTPNTIDFSEVHVEFYNIDDPSGVLVLVTVCLAFLAYFVALVFARRADKSDAQKVSPPMPLSMDGDAKFLYMVSITTGAQRNSGTSSNVSMILHGSESSSGIVQLRSNLLRRLFSRGNKDNFILALDQSLGVLNQIEIGHDDQGDNPSWFLNEISVKDLQTNVKRLFRCYRWLALERDDGKTTRVLHTSSIKPQEGFKQQFSSAQVNGLANDHIWLSVATKEPLNSFTRVQRASCCCFVLFWSMVTSAMFYRTKPVTQLAVQVGPLRMSSNELIVSFWTVLVAFPPSLLVVFLFRNSKRTKISQGDDENYEERHKQFKLPHFCLYVAWFFCIVGSFSSALFTIFYSIEWGGEKSGRWFSAFFLSTTQDVLLSQPVKIIVVSMILASRCLNKERQNGTNEDDALQENRIEKSGENRQTLFKMSEQYIDSQRRNRLLEQKTDSFLKEIAFLFVFMILLVIVCYGDRSDDRYRVAKTIKDELKKFNTVSNLQKFWDSLREIFVPALFTNEWYNGQVEPVSEYTRSKRLIVLGMPRLRQLRISKGSCDVPHPFKTTIPSCYDFYSEKEEDKAGWYTLLQKNSSNRFTVMCPENWRYTTEEKLGGFKSWGDHAFYGGGGYIANLGYDKSTADWVLNYLQINNWIDSQTRAVLVEFSLFSPSTNLLADTTIYCEIHPSGFMATSVQINEIPLSKGHSDLMKAYTFVILIFALFLGYYLLSECVRLYRLKCKYWASIWNWLQMLLIISAVLTLTLSWAREAATLRVLQQIEQNPFAPVSFESPIILFSAENYAVCITVTMATLRILRILKCNRHVLMLILSLRKCLRPLASFSAVFAVVFTGYAHTGALLFGSQVYMLSTFYKTISLLLLMSLGSSIPLRDLEWVHTALGRLYVFSFLSLMTFILLNVFVAILNDVYGEFSTNDKTSTEDFEVAERLLKKFLTLFGFIKKAGKNCDNAVDPKQSHSNNVIQKREETLESGVNVSPQGMILGGVQNAQGTPSVDKCHNKRIDPVYDPVSRIVTSPTPPISRTCPRVESRDNLPASMSESNVTLEIPGGCSVRTAHFSSHLDVREFDNTATDLSSGSNDAIDFCIVECKSKLSRGHTAHVVCSADRYKLGLDKESKSIAVSCKQRYQSSMSANCKQRKGILDFDAVSQWMKEAEMERKSAEIEQNERRSVQSRLNACGKGNQLKRVKLLDFDAISKMIRRRKKPQPSESNTKRLENRSEQLGRLLDALAFVED